MEMPLPVYTLKEIPVEAVTFATPVTLSGHLSGLFQSADGALSGSLLAVSAPVQHSQPPGPLLAVSAPAQHSQAPGPLLAVSAPAQVSQSSGPLLAVSVTAQHAQSSGPLLAVAAPVQQSLSAAACEEVPQSAALLTATAGQASEPATTAGAPTASSPPAAPSFPAAAAADQYKAESAERRDDEDEPEWAPRRKRARTDLTIEQKRQICLYHNENGNATAKQMVDYFHKEWGVVVGRSTVAAVIGNKNKWLSMSEEKAKSKRARTGKHEIMEQRLHSWYTERRSAGMYVSRERLFSKAKEIGHSVGIPNTFTYSKGWLQKFQTRYSFRVTSEKSKTDAASKRFVLFKRKQLDRDLESTAPADVFCFGEFPLLYQLVPRQSVVRSPAAMREHGRSVLVCLCPNMTGSTRLPPLVVGRTVTCGFSSKFSLDKLLQYRYSARGLLTDPIFSEWLYRVDEGMRRQERNILLLVGATSCNVERNYKLTNVKLRFLSTIGARSPFEHGIKTAFKIAYRRLQCQHLLSESRDALDGPDLRDAIYLIRESWQRLTDAVIVGAWSAVGVVTELRLAGAAAASAAAAAEAAEVVPEVVLPPPPPPPPAEEPPLQQLVAPLPASHELPTYYYPPLHQQQPSAQPALHSHPPPPPHHMQQQHEQQHPQQQEHHQHHQHQHHTQQQQQHPQEPHQELQQQQHEHHQQQEQQQHSHQHQYQSPMQPQQQQQQQAYFHNLQPSVNTSLQQMTSVSSYDPGLSQHFLAPFGVTSHTNGGYLLPEHTELRPETPPKPPPPPPPLPPPPLPPRQPVPPALPDPGELNLAAMRRLRDELARLSVPADDLLTVEWLLSVDELPEPDDEPAVRSTFVAPPDHVTHSVAKWAADVLLAYLEQRDADLPPIDHVLDIRRKWVLNRRSGDDAELE